MLRFYISIFLIVYLVTHFFSLYLNMKKTIIFLLSLYLHNCFGYNYLSSMLEIASSYMTNPDYFNKQFKKLSEGSFSFDNRNSKDSDTTTIENTTPISTIISQLSTASISIPKCGVRRMQHTELIRNGSPTKPGDWPWHVALYRLSNNGSQQYICGGSIIDQYRVITGK